MEDAVFVSSALFDSSSFLKSAMRTQVVSKPSIPPV